MPETVTDNITVAQMVRNDYRTAEVFKKYGINYCCSGNISLEEACRLKELDATQVHNDLAHATRNILVSNSLNFDEWDVGFLADYITNVHHAYEDRMLPSFQANLISFVNSHKKQHSELAEVVETVDEIIRLISFQNKHENEILFPYIKQLENMHRRKEVYGNLFVRTMRKPLNDTEDIHVSIGGLLERLRKATNHYRFPAQACTNHQVVFRQLEAMDQDLVQHIHLENNILFPKAKEMERALLER
ncbi:MAG TPA: DUF542 domain-containing protein [Flavisolibacter sp.]|nr:DUF542 domain-containing protein [Flavisolibacter sp.]